MSSMHAAARRSLASRKRRVRRLFSRASHSASRSRPKRSSKESRAISELDCCWVHASTIASRRSAFSFSIVGSLSISIPPSVVIFLSANVLVWRRRWLRWGGGLGQRRAIEPGLQDRFDALVGAGAHDERAMTRGLQPLGPVPFAEPHDAEARAVAVLGVRALGDDRGHELLGLR